MGRSPSDHFDTGLGHAVLDSKHYRCKPGMALKYTGMPGKRAPGSNSENEKQLWLSMLFAIAFVPALAPMLGVSTLRSAALWAAATIGPGVVFVVRRTVIARIVGIV